MGILFCERGAGRGATLPAHSFIYLLLLHRRLAVNENSLPKAVALAKTGDKAAARAILRQIVASEPGNETAWGWLAYCAETEIEKRQALERVIEINPANKGARRELEKMGVAGPILKPRPKARSKSRTKRDSRRAAKPQKRGCIRTLVIAGLVIVILACIGSFLGSNDSDNGNRATKKPSTLEAWNVCRDRVMSSLKAPSTAKFPTLDRDFVREHENGNWRVAAWVDAQNAFGAMIRTHFICILRYEGNRWQVKDFLLE
jgi:hypothetical protein